jgi:hypothetical protein
MAKVYKAEIYISDYNGEIYISDNGEINDDIKNFLESLLENRWVGIKVSDIKESEEFEWHDDLVINKTKATTEDFEKYFKDEKDYRLMAKSFIGETMKDFFCNGFFGSRTYDLTGAEITKVYDSADDNAIVIEVRKSDGRYDYGYFNDGWRDWQTVYKHLDEWVNGEQHE